MPLSKDWLNFISMGNNCHMFFNHFILFNWNFVRFSRWNYICTFTTSLNVLKNADVVVRLITPRLQCVLAKVHSLSWKTKEIQCHLFLAEQVCIQKSKPIDIFKALLIWKRDYLRQSLGFAVPPCTLTGNSPVKFSIFHLPSLNLVSCILAPKKCFRKLF